MLAPIASIRALAEILRNGALHDAEVADKFLTTLITESELHKRHELRQAERDGPRKG